MNNCTYSSSLERDVKSLTVQTLTELCEVIEVHSLTMLTLAFSGAEQRGIRQLLGRIRHE
ncbi:XRE family transcriptional regulator [Advenella kashmirensis]